MLVILNFFKKQIQIISQYEYGYFFVSILNHGASNDWLSFRTITVGHWFSTEGSFVPQGTFNMLLLVVTTVEGGVATGI